MSQRSVISASIQANFPDNQTNFITPTRLRDEQYTFLYDTVLNEQTASIIAQAVASASANPVNTGSLVTTSSFNAYTASTNTFTGSIQTQVNALRAATSSYVTNAQTSSMSVLSASFASSSVSASFAISASWAPSTGGSGFPFSGSAQITGSLGVTGSIEGSNQNGLKINLGSGNTIPNVGANGNALSFGNSITNNTQNNGFAFGDSHTIANPGYNNFIAGGNTNTLNNNRGFAGGGLNNTINNIDGAIIGGSSNTVNHDGAIILGGTGQTTIDDSTVHMNRANIGDWSSGAYVSFNQSGSNQVVLKGGVSIIAEDNSSIDISGSTIPALLRIRPSNYLDLTTGAWISTNFGGFTTGSSGQVLTRSGSSIVWSTPSGGSVSTGSLLTTASVSLNTITFTKGDGSTFPITVNTGSGGGGGMNLGANTFTGSQTIQSASLLLQASSSIALNPNFLTQSTAGTTDGANIFMLAGSIQSGSVIISGSRNIGTVSPGNNATVTTRLAGFNGNGNFGVFTTSYSTASAAPTLSNNVLFSAIAHLMTNTSSITTANNNIIQGTVTITGSATSANTISSNNIDTVTIENNWSGSGANQATVVFGNIIKGFSQAATGQVFIKFASTGSNANTRGVINNIFYGHAITASMEASGAAQNLYNTAVIGAGLVVSGTMPTNAPSGAMFVGQWNETGSLADASQVKFAVGAGITSGSRRTPFYVSGSGEVIIKPNLTTYGKSTFGDNRVVIGDGVINGSFASISAGNGSFVTNGGTISAGQTNVLIAGELNTITQARSSIIAGATSNTLNTTQIGGNDTNNAIIGSQYSTISGSLSITTGIYSSSGSIITGSRQSAIIAGNTLTKLANTTGSVALGRDTAYTGTANYTLYTQNVDISGSLTVNGNLQYNVGSFFSTASQSGSANVSQSITFDTTDISTGVSIVSGSQIKLTNAGTYNIQFSAQVDRVSGTGSDVIYIWLKKNGSNVANTAGAVTVTGGAAAAKVLAAWNYVVNAAANDYYELAWQSADANIVLTTIAASGNIPAIPSVILTVTQDR
jgi:hypothetical protein